MRYLTLLGVQLRQSLQLSMQYRWDFLIEGLLSVVFGAGAALAPLWVAFDARPSIAGWTFPEAVVVVGFFTLVRGVLEGAVNPSLLSVVEKIRLGTLDFVLLKPADAQFLVSTSRFAPWHVIDLFAGFAMFVWAFDAMGRTPSFVAIALSALLLVAAILILYALWILVISAAFHVVRVDNLAYLFASLFDAARWPASVFRGAARFIFTFVVPLALMTTLPAEALLDRLDLRGVLTALGGAVLFAALARFVWLRSIRRYTSASS